MPRPFFYNIGDDGDSSPDDDPYAPDDASAAPDDASYAPAPSYAPPDASYAPPPPTGLAGLQAQLAALKAAQPAAPAFPPSSGPAQPQPQPAPQPGAPDAPPSPLSSARSALLDASSAENTDIDMNLPLWAEVMSSDTPSSDAVQWLVLGGAQAAAFHYPQTAAAISSLLRGFGFNPDGSAAVSSGARRPSTAQATRMKAQAQARTALKQLAAKYRVTPAALLSASNAAKAALPNITKAVVHTRIPASKFGKAHVQTVARKAGVPVAAVQAALRLTKTR